jgi:hypothetical protein
MDRASGRFRALAGPATTARHDVRVVALLCRWQRRGLDQGSHRERFA